MGDDQFHAYLFHYDHTVGYYGWLILVMKPSKRNPRGHHIHEAKIKNVGRQIPLIHF
ncbi:hypothetical protein F3157_17385 [Virgibacillus dakarensis]|uniref:hypothetical protein n=1 Tax=Virgibacillus dakarensis TaxID=1917889 RepID=UPI0012D93FFE|nr:hypothetical protein [Virgibacillus dakarensis]MTW87408.1 hypothetical protein [Virgibacillus dakarensis]